MALEDMLVLASSRKPGGRCLAGLALGTGRLVRPVSPTPERSLTLRDCSVDGRWPEPLDVVRIDHAGADTLPWQPENVLNVAGSWRFRRRVAATEALELVAPHLLSEGAIFGNFGRAVHHEEAESGVARSLAVVSVTSPRIEHEATDWGSGHRVVVHFRHASREWSMTLTDLDVAPRALGRPSGTYRLAEIADTPAEQALLTLSLGDTHGEWHQKLVAAVIPIG